MKPNSNLNSMKFFSFIFPAQAGAAGRVAIQSLLVAALVLGAGLTERGYNA